MIIWILSIFYYKNSTNFNQANGRILNGAQGLNIQCSDLINFTFHINGVNIKCHLTPGYINHDKFYQYEEFANSQIGISNYEKDVIHFHFEDIHNDLPDEHITKIISSIRTRSPYDVSFFGFYNLDKIQFYRNFFNGDAGILVILESDDCFLEREDNYPIEIKEKNHWRKFCYYTNSGKKQSILGYNDDEIVKIQYINENTLTLFVVLVVVFIFVNLIILFIIVIYRIKKHRENTSFELEKV